MAKQFLLIYAQIHLGPLLDLHLFQLRLLIFLISYSKHLFDQLIAAIMALASTHFGIVRTICYCLDDTVAGIMLILSAFIRIAYAKK